LFIPDSDPDFLPIPIPNQGVKKGRHRIQDPDAILVYISQTLFADFVS
jgi:hypothetical protein